MNFWGMTYIFRESGKYKKDDPNRKFMFNNLRNGIERDHSQGEYKISSTTREDFVGRKPDNEILFELDMENPKEGNFEYKVIQGQRYRISTRESPLADKKKLFDLGENYIERHFSERGSLPESLNLLIFRRGKSQKTIDAVFS